MVTLAQSERVDVKRQSGLSIFISHKHEDQAAALKVKELLENFNVEHQPPLICHVSEIIPGGEDWIKWIHDRLRESNILLLLFTDSTRNWDWCLFETGLYLPLDPSPDSMHGRVVCIYSKTPPAPIMHLQAYEATPDKVEMFLRHLLVDNELTDLAQPIAPWLARVPDQLRETATKISKLVSGGPERTVHHGEFFLLRIKDPKNVPEHAIPSDAQISTLREASWALFDKEPGDWTWGELEEEARKNDDTRWLSELANAVYRTCHRSAMNPIQATFQSRRSATTYRPILYRTDWNADGSLICKILFTEDVSWQMQAVERRIAVLLDALTMGTRFRFEVLDRYRPTVEALIRRHPDETIRAIREAITNIEMESASRNLLDRDTLLGVFATVEHRDQVSQMFDMWYDLREQLFRALDDRDGETVRDQIDKLVLINRDFMNLASQRYHELVAEVMC